MVIARRLARMSVVVAAVVMNVGIAKADTIQSFSISGTGITYGDGTFTLSGEMSFDITDKTLVSIDLNFPNSLSILPRVGNTYSADVSSGRPGDPGTIAITMTPDQAGDGFYIGGTLVGSLIPIGTAAASECGIFPEPCLEQVTGYSGEVTPATPLPAALPLFATGLGAIGLFGWRKKRTNAASVTKPPLLRD
jgi:hypothetical protein